jgi:hypothetical protein
MSKIKNMKLRYKIAAGVTAGAMVIGGAGVAFAYVTGGSGSGGGTATATAPTENNLTTSASITNPVSFGGSQPISITVTNGNTYSLGWANDSVSLASVSTTSPACPAGSFTVTGSSAGSGVVGAGTSTTVSSGFTLNFVDLGTSSNQTGCEAATVTFSSSVSAT